MSGFRPFCYVVGGACVEGYGILFKVSAPTLPFFPDSTLSATLLCLFHPKRVVAGQSICLVVFIRYQVITVVVG